MAHSAFTHFSGPWQDIATRFRGYSQFSGLIRTCKFDKKWFGFQTCRNEKGNSLLIVYGPQKQPIGKKDGSELIVYLKNKYPRVPKIVLHKLLTSDAKPLLYKITQQCLAYQFIESNPLDHIMMPQYTLVRRDTPEYEAIPLNARNKLILTTEAVVQLLGGLEGDLLVGKIAQPRLGFIYRVRRVARPG